MSDSDSLLSDSDDEIDIVAQANKAKAAFESAPAKPEAVEEVKEEEVGNSSAASEAKNLEEEAAEAAKQEEEEAERLAAEAKEKEEAERLAAEAREKEEAERLAAESREKEEAERLAAEAREKEEAERLAAEAREKEEAERLEKEQAARLAAEEEEKRQQEEREREEKRQQEEERKQKEEAERKQREAEEQKRKEEESERKRLEEEERKKQADAAAESAEEAEAEEDEEQAEEPKEANAEEDVSAAPPRVRANSTMHDLHSQKISDIAEKDRLEKLKAKENMQKFSTIVNPFKSEAEKAEEIAIKKRMRRKTELANRKAEYKNEIEDGERRLTEYKALRKKGKKKKAWKPLMLGYVGIVNSPFKMKKGKAHKVSDGMYYMATQLLPQSCNIDETEAEWTKNKRSDTLCPALVAFSSRKKYDEFAEKVAGKNMKDASGLMAMAKYASGLCHLKEDFAIGSDVATAIANLKTNFIRTEAVLPVDSFRGGDSGEDNQFVLVDRKQAFVFMIEDEGELSQWQEKLKSLQPTE